MDEGDIVSGRTIATQFPDRPVHPAKGLTIQPRPDRTSRGYMWDGERTLVAGMSREQLREWGRLCIKMASEL